ncbi:MULTISPECIES: uracil-xanthine permease family protein [unclassified Cryobacterium]|uniref:uracil-xanthine permease family protein n=1 Tax=unclassified Cryobacterium TaxID=2649013 RepID=UPI00106903CC|nr:MULTISPECIES: solute carrier family 23 protein [unclassified Cryobacterium]MDY7527096.1 solute carrier family 23 protein [Cryobacterium sp. 10C2]MDY7557117.1 solute carrier family 23 protein [Cryobacterium sp. 10C3]MEB0003628.1 solute carrier family 23 protein [Cryobacterium sp. RTC2.1]MEB0286224.1 solute carrier family 23 protein [Cryobacterium sp. 10S3]MEB0290274.1 solute carrier family 23 protein [Cryobacterium sp. 10C2]
MALPWTLHGDGKTVGVGDVVGPGERLNWPLTIGIGAQHVVAMFGATFLVPLLTGFPPSTTLFFSGVGTLLFLIITKNKLPSYLGSSFAFIAPITAAVTTAGMGSALFGILAVGALLAIIGVVVQVTGTGWIDALMPPVVSGAIVALIGFNLAPVAKANFALAPLTAVITLAAVILSTVLFRGILGRLSIVIGVAVGYLAAVLSGQVDFSKVNDAAWIGLPPFTLPTNPFENAAVLGVLPAFLPVVLVLVAENVGHIRGVAQMTDAKVNRFTGRALMADGLATMLAGFSGGSGTTTYGENIGVMAATRIYSTAAYWVAGLVAVLLGLSPKIGAVINTIPAGVLGGVTTALYGLIGIIGVKIWLDNKVDFSRPVNQFTAATALIIGIADYTFTAGSLSFNGIALGTVAAIVIYHTMTVIGRLRRTDR